MKLPKVNILTTAWNRHPARLEYFKIMVESVEKYLDWGDVEHDWIVSIEEFEHYRKEEMEEYMLEHNIRWSYHPPPPGLGRNMNYALSLCDAPLIFYIQDDCVQVYPLSIEEDIKYLIETPDVGLIRYYVKYQRDIDRKHLKRFDKERKYYYLNKDAGYYYNDHVQLKKKSFHDLTGPYNESFRKGMDFSKCENSMCSKARKVYDQMKIIVKATEDKRFINGYFGKQKMFIHHNCLKEKQIFHAERNDKNYKLPEDDLKDWLDGKIINIDGGFRQ